MIGKRLKPANELLLRDPRSGKSFVVIGADSMASTPLDLDPDVDLTKPIARQIKSPRTKRAVTMQEQS